MIFLIPVNNNNDDDENEQQRKKIDLIDVIFIY